MKRIEIPDSFKNRKMFAIMHKGEIIATVHVYANLCFINNFGDSTVVDKTERIREWDAEEIRNS